MSTSAARRLQPSESGAGLAKQDGIKKGPHRFAPGVSGNPAGRPPGRSREMVVQSLFELLAKVGDKGVSYQEQMIRTILSSETLLGKFLDKLLPNMSQDQTNLVFNNFEAVLAQVQAQRAAIAFTQSPGLPAPVAVEVKSTPEPELEPITRKGGG